VAGCEAAQLAAGRLELREAATLDPRWFCKENGALGLGRIVALPYCSPTLYQVH
jgi:hypothetical protein